MATAAAAILPHAGRPRRFPRAMSVTHRLVEIVAQRVFGHACRVARHMPREHEAARLLPVALSISTSGDDWRYGMCGRPVLWIPADRTHKTHGGVTLIGSQQSLSLPLARSSHGVQTSASGGADRDTLSDEGCSVLHWDEQRRRLAASSISESAAPD